MREIMMSPLAAERLAWNELLPVLKMQPDLYHLTKPPFSKVKSPEPGSLPKPLPDEICYRELISGTHLNSGLWEKNTPPSLREKYIAEFLKSGLSVVSIRRKKARIAAANNKNIHKGRSLDIVPDLTTDLAREATRRGAGRVLEMAAREPRHPEAPWSSTADRLDAYLSRLNKLTITPVPLRDCRLTPEHEMAHIYRVLAAEFSS